ncbi:MAG: 6-phosphogluconolactonase [Ignavibacteriales bacterium]|nr:6-phosphogluconolactonase [Ignavibacteriales bacterium]
MKTKIYDPSSKVEECEINRGKHKALYSPTEKIKVIEIDNYPLLGKFTAFRFIEWVQKNQGGVIALPTGKTPEYFIKWVQRILSQWDTNEIQSILETYDMNRSARPEMKDLTFIQIDEFYPMNSNQNNSFYYYINEFYIVGFGLSKENALLIDSTSLGIPHGKTMGEIFPNNIVDLTLRVRKTTTELERIQRDVINRIDEYCMEYETKIRELGGIGFFLGGIGPDGHIAFNVRGSSIHSVTRLTATNYETQAATATDLGGIEISRNRLVITIGLATITYNPTVTAIIMAAGEAKAEVVAHAIQEKRNPQYPASVLQDIPNSRFYLTRGASACLIERQYEDISKIKRFSEEESDRIVISLALSKNKSLQELNIKDFTDDRFGSVLLKSSRVDHVLLTDVARQNIIQKLDRGLMHVSGTTFLHTEPHHDDIMLSYLAHIYHLVRDASNLHYFANLTSGFTSVTNAYVLSVLMKLEKFLNSESFTLLFNEGYFESENHSNRQADVYMFLDGVAANNPEKRDNAEACRLLRNMFDIYLVHDLEKIKQRIKELHDYFNTQYPGAKDPIDIQTLKGTLREWEVESLWAYFGIETSSIFPLRLGFYTGDIFAREPEINRDVIPIYNLIKKIKPDIVSVAFDPEGSGPDTHYKALQAVASALNMYEKETGDSHIKVWGYRNVWYRFDQAEADLIIPVSLNSLSLLHTAFMNCFGSQRAASFPSYDHDGPFSELAQKIQVKQYSDVKTCLGKDYFLKNSHPRLRAARGMIFLKEMKLSDFYKIVRELKIKTEGETIE